MAIIEAEFDNEKELDVWVRDNLDTFLPSSKYLAPFQVCTISGKRGLPDGFAYDLVNKEWYLIEAELLSHGVWPHIAEQITRFVVAIQNPETRRLIRDHFFESIIANDFMEEASELLDTTPERLLQQIELFIEGTDPQVVIFIDDTNQDLYDMAHALSAQIKIFRVKKFIVNGNIEYHSPDQNVPVLVTERPVEQGVPISEFNVIETMGGGDLDRTTARFKCYRMSDGTVIHIKRSKYHARHDYYWYGITPTALDNCASNGITHIVFVMGGEGFVSIPLKIVNEFVVNTRTSDNEDGSVRHYHCLITPGPDPELYYSQEIPRFDLAEFYQQIL